MVATQSMIRGRKAAERHPANICQSDSVRAKLVQFDYRVTEKANSEIVQVTAIIIHDSANGVFSYEETKYEYKGVDVSDFVMAVSDDLWVDVRQCIYDCCEAHGFDFFPVAEGKSFVANTYKWKEQWLQSIGDAKPHVMTIDATIHEFHSEDTYCTLPVFNAIGFDGIPVTPTDDFTPTGFYQDVYDTLRYGFYDDKKVDFQKVIKSIQGEGKVLSKHFKTA